MPIETWATATGFEQSSLWNRLCLANNAFVTDRRLQCLQQRSIAPRINKEHQDKGFLLDKWL
jgi:hypothetical protein